MSRTAKALIGEAKHLWEKERNSREWIRFEAEQHRRAKQGQGTAGNGKEANSEGVAKHGIDAQWNGYALKSKESQWNGKT